MKNIFSTLIMCISLTLVAQNGTTLEEYRYLTKGFAYQKEMGLDATKEGYQFHQLYNHPNGISFIAMYKNSSTPQALLAIIPDGKQNTYVCLPNNSADEDVMKQFETDFRNIPANGSKKQRFDEAHRGLLFYLMGERPEVSLANAANQDSRSTAFEITDKGIPEQRYNLPTSEYSSTQTITISPASGNDEEADNDANVVNKNVDMEIGGELEKRSLLNPPVVFGTYTNRGKVVIKICVDEQGSVIFAKFTQLGSTTFSPDLKQMAIDSALTTRFSQSPEREQCGVIAYHFK